MRLGYHVSRNTSDKKIYTALEESLKNLRSYGFESVSAQIFVTGPQSHKVIISDVDAAKVRALSEQMTIIVHGAYIDFPWSLKPGSLNNIRKEMQLAHDCGAAGVVVHIGKGAENQETVNSVLESIAKIPRKIKDSVVLYLEMQAAKPSPSTVETPEKLVAFWNRLKSGPGGLRLGICIDSAHLFSCGISLETESAAASWLTAAVPDDMPVMFHLNDSGSTLGSGVDLHAPLTKGNIWKNDQSGLNYLLKWAENRGAVVILERNEEHVAWDLELISEKIERSD